MYQNFKKLETSSISLRFRLIYQEQIIVAWFRIVVIDILKIEKIRDISYIFAFSYIISWEDYICIIKNLYKQFSKNEKIR